MTRNNEAFHYGHGMGWEPKIGPSMQQLKKPARDYDAAFAGNVMSSYYPDAEKMVKISSIKSLQRDVEAKHVNRLASMPAESLEPVSLWKNSRGLYLHDGNHRVAAALARGETHINARIYSNPYNK